MKPDISELPEGWRRIPLGSVGRWGSGGTPDRQQRHYYGGPIPWIKIGDLTDGRIIRTEETITEEGLSGSSAKLIDPEALLVAMYGASIGKLGITGMRSTTNQAIAFCIPDSELTSTEFLFQLLLYLRPTLIGQGKGGAQPNISQSVLKSLEVPLPPLDQQAQIVQALESIGSHHANAAQRLTTARKIIHHFRQAVLLSACSGRLTADWRERHLGPAVLQEQRAQNVSPLIETPNEWPWQTLQEIADVRGGIQKGARLGPR